MKAIVNITSVKAGHHKAISLFGLLLFLVISNIHAQQSISYALHANIIYRFAKYAEWPDDNKKGDFIIGIVGATELHDELEHFIENKTAAGDKKIVIKKLSSTAGSYFCQILFISEDKSKSLKKIAEITRDLASKDILNGKSREFFRSDATPFIPASINKFLKIK